MTYQEKILDIIRSHLNELRLFDNLFSHYYPNDTKCEYVLTIGPNEYKKEDDSDVILIATPKTEVISPETIWKKYRGAWGDIVGVHDYVFGNIARNVNFEENKILIKKLQENSIKIDISTDDFNNGEVVLEKLAVDYYDSFKLITSFTNEVITHSDKFVHAYKYGPENSSKKGRSFMGTFGMFDVHGVPGISQDVSLAVIDNNIGVKISPLRTEIERRYLLHVLEDISIWQICSNSVVSINFI